MSFHGRLQDAIWDTLWEAPGGYSEDIPGLLRDLPFERVNKIMDELEELFHRFASELNRKRSRERGEAEAVIRGLVRAMERHIMSEECGYNPSYYGPGSENEQWQEAMKAAKQYLGEWV